MNRFAAAVFILAWMVAHGFARAGQAWSAEEKRAFVEKSLQDTNVYVHNVPPPMHRHLNKTLKEMTAWWQYASQNGTELYLYPDGSPWAYWSNAQGKQNGPSKLWYRNGQLAADESFDHGKIATGRYYDEGGKLVSEMTNGTGRRMLLEVRQTDKPGPTGVIVTDYRDGLEDGIKTMYAGGVKISEAHYVKGKANGVAAHWDKGKRIGEENFKDGKQDGLDIVWYPSGVTNAISHYREGRIESSEGFFMDGTKFKETAYGANGLNAERYFYENGAVMVEQTGRGNEIVNARNFDPAGKVTSEVKDGDGTLVTAFERLPRFDTYRHGERIKSMRLPYFKLAPGAEILAGATNDTTFHLSVILDDEITSVKADITLPPDVKSDRKLSFTGTNIIGAGMFGPFELQFSAPHHEWKDRDTLVEAEVELKGVKVRYQSYAVHEKLDRAGH